MKNILIAICLLIPLVGFCQDRQIGIHEYVMVEQEPLPLNYGKVKAQIGYPIEAIKHKIEGKVYCRILIDEKGRYVRHRFSPEAHPALMAAVQPHLSQLQYSPAMQNAQPIPYWVTVFFQFSHRSPVIRNHMRTRKHQLQKPRVRSWQKCIQAFEEGSRLLEIGKWNAAKLAFERSIQWNPYRKQAQQEARRLLVLAQMERGKLLAQQRRWPEALTALNEAIGVSMECQEETLLGEEEMIGLYLCRSQVFMEMGLPIRGLDDCNWLLQTVEEQVELLEVYCQRAQAYVQLKQYQAAFSDVEYANQLDPAHPLPHYEKAQILIELEGTDAAIQFMRQAMNLGLAGSGKKQAEIFLAEFDDGIHF